MDVVYSFVLIFYFVPTTPRVWLPTVMDGVHVKWPSFIGLAITLRGAVLTTVEMNKDATITNICSGRQMKILKNFNFENFYENFK